MNEMFDNEGNIKAEYIHKEILENVAEKYAEIAVNAIVTELPYDIKAKRYILLKMAGHLINEQKRLKINE